MTEAQSTADEAVAGGEWAFRLKDETPVYEMPDASGAVVTVLPAGAIVTVHDRAGGFLRVITPSDSFGFIPAGTAVADIEPMSLAPPPDASVQAELEPAPAGFYGPDPALAARRARAA